MFFAKTVVAILAAASSALAITINTPSPSSYWVQFSSNVIQWTFNSGDSNPIDITVTNNDTSLLNGFFSIARFVDLSAGSFTVTNVTLVVGTGYVVNFVNPANGSDIFASSQPFEVKVNGTTPASVSLSATSTAPGASGTGANSTSTSTSHVITATNAAGRALSADSPAFAVAMGAGMALAGGFLAL